MGGEVGNLFWKISVFRYSAVNVWDSREERYRLRNIKFIFTIRIRNPEAKLFLALNSGSKWNFPFKDFAICFHMISVGKWEKWEKQNLCLQSRFLSEKKEASEFFIFHHSTPVYSESKESLRRWTGHGCRGTDTLQIRIYGAWLLIFNILWRNEHER